MAPDEEDKVDDHAASSSSSSSSSSSDDDDDDDGDSIRFSPSHRIRNMERHAKFLSELDTKYAKLMPDLVAKPTKKESSVDQGRIETIDEQVQGKNIHPRGMRLLIVSKKFDSPKVSNTVTTQAELLEHIRKRFPHRELQLQLLTSLVTASIGQACCKTDNRSKSTCFGFVPPPIFISGPPGTGKTAIVRHIIDVSPHMIPSTRSSNNDNDMTTQIVARAYIDCTQREASSIQGLLAFAYGQLRPASSRTERQRDFDHKRKRRTAGKISVTSSDVKSVKNESGTNESKGHAKDGQAIVDGDQSTAKPTGLSSDRTSREAPIETQGDSNIQEPDPPELETRRMQPGRRAKKQRIHHPKKISTPSVGGESSLAENDGFLAQMSEVWASRAAVAAFGRNLRPFFGPTSARCAFLIMDHAERLFSDNGTERKNFLPELLLLPKALELNLTILIVTNNCCLDATRLNNTMAARKSLSTISQALHPFRVQFPAYRGVEMFKQILAVPEVSRLITGDSIIESSELRTRFRFKVLDSFLGALVQSLSGITRDLREYIRLGRSLWPKHIEPLHTSNLDKTIELAKKSSSKPLKSPSAEMEEAVVEILDQKMLRLIGQYLSRGIFSLSLDSPAVQETKSLVDRKKQAAFALEPLFLRNCLLLSAFICQHNAADKDRNVFLIRGSGKRGASNRSTECANEDIAFASEYGGQQQVKAIRARPFPLERMLSIFVTLVGLNHSRGSLLKGMDVWDLLRTLGSTQLCDYFSQLRAHVHQVKYNGGITGEQINLNACKYWCSLTRDRAEAIAKANNIPLSNYLT